jgi:streptomycin 6-kinase
MTHEYIARMYRAGQDDEARRALAREIARSHAGPEDPPTYKPTEAEIDAAEAEYYAARRAYRYGSLEHQMEYIAEYSLAAWQAEVAQIKTEIPKPG